MLAVLFIMGALCALHQAAIDISLMEDGVLTATFPNAFVLRYPNCSTHGNKSVTVWYQELPGGKNESKTFTAPTCNNSKPGFVLTDLKNGTTYTMWYESEADKSPNLTSTTATVRDVREINDGLPARSGAMVVITVLLVLALLALLAGFIFVVFLSG